MADTESQMTETLVNAAPLPGGNNGIAPVPDAGEARLSQGPKTELAMKLTEQSAPVPVNPELAAPIPHVGTEIIEVEEEEKKESSLNKLAYDDKPLQLLLDGGQKINAETIKDVGENDEKWRYNMTLGDIAQFKVPTIADPDKRSDCWFAMEGSKRYSRKVFLQGKVKRLSEIDPRAESFRVSLQIVMYWYITRTEYMDYLVFKSHNNAEGWSPAWVPSISLPNAIELEKNEFFEYPNRGKFPILVVKGLGLGRQLDIEPALQDSIANHSVVCKAKLEVSGVFCEELEIYNFPFDVQPLTININSKVDPDVPIKAIFLPALRRTNFFSFDPRYSVYSEWDLDRFHVEFGDRDRRSTKNNVTGMNIRIILKRRWSIYVFRSFLVIALIDMLGLSAYALDDAGNRLELLLALLLTLVVAIQELLNEPRMTFLGKYGLSGFMYLVLLTIQSTFVEDMDEDLDRMFLYIFGILFVVKHVFWIVYAIWARKDEVRRSYADADELDDEAGYVKIVSSWKKASRGGKKNRLLSFISETWTPTGKKEAKKPKDTKETKSEK
eukprot:49006_1